MGQQNLAEEWNVQIFSEEVGSALDQKGTVRAMHWKGKKQRGSEADYSVVVGTSMVPMDFDISGGANHRELTFIEHLLCAVHASH